MNTLFKESGAEFSECGKYRYKLWRIWDDALPKAMCIGLNPSTANAVKPDPTIGILCRMLKKLGYGGFYMTNLFAFISSNPDDLLTCLDPIGDNDSKLKEVEALCSEVIACYGNFKKASERIADVMPNYQNALCFGFNKNGTPCHPLALMYNGTQNKPELINLNPPNDMKKTTIQDGINRLAHYKGNYQPSKYDHKYLQGFESGLQYAIESLTSLLPAERQQIEDAYEQGDTDRYLEHNDKVRDFEDAQMYYNTTYGQPDKDYSEVTTNDVGEAYVALKEELDSIPTHKPIIGDKVQTDEEFVRLKFVHVFLNRSQLHNEGYKYQIVDANTSSCLPLSDRFNNSQAAWSDAADRIRNKK